MTFDPNKKFPLPPGREWVPGNKITVGRVLHGWCDYSLSKPYQLASRRVVKVAGENFSMVDCANSQPMGTWSAHCSFFYEADVESNQSVNRIYQGTFPVSDKRAIPEYPHTCPRCNQPAYVGLFEVAHASPTACPARTK